MTIWKAMTCPEGGGKQRAVEIITSSIARHRGRVSFYVPLLSEPCDFTLDRSSHRGIPATFLKEPIGFFGLNVLAAPIILDRYVRC